MFNRIAALISAVTWATLAFGPPGLKIESVANPATAKVRNAVFMVTGHHHSDSAGFGVTGRVEGVTAGKRTTKTLALTSAGSPGVFGVTKQWETGQPLVLIFTVSEGGHDEHGVAEGLVKISSKGAVLGIEYPMGKLNEKTPWPRKVTEAEIASALASMAGR